MGCEGELSGISYPEAFRLWYAENCKKADTKTARKGFLDLVGRLERRDDRMDELIEDIQKRLDRALGTTEEKTASQAKS